MLELLPNVALPFLKKRRAAEYAAAKAAAAAAPAAAEAEAAPVAAEEPITGPVVKAPMPGRIISIDVAAGDKVTKGKTLLVYEAMKMENDVTADRDCTVKRVFVAPGDQIGNDTVLIEFAD